MLLSTSSEMVWMSRALLPISARNFCSFCKPICMYQKDLITIQTLRKKGSFTFFNSLSNFFRIFPEKAGSDPRSSITVKRINNCKKKRITDLIDIEHFCVNLIAILWIIIMKWVDVFQKKWKHLNCTWACLHTTVYQKFQSFVDWLVEIVVKCHKYWHLLF